MTVACGSASGYRVSMKFTPESTQPSAHCTGAAAATQVPQLPVADQVLGDIIVRCKDSCPRDYAISALLFEAHKMGADHVSSLACVRDGADWQCVGRLSSPEHCK